jgi:cytochrome c-type biogenesis protein CcmH/NrfF
LPDASAVDPLDKVAVPLPELENRPRSDFESSLMGEIGCMCGDCERKPINTCGCEFAAKMRAEVLAELDRHDLSTEAGRGAAAGSVRAFEVARYGPKVLHHSPNLDAPVAVAALVLVVGIGIRTVRRRRRRTVSHVS